MRIKGQQFKKFRDALQDAYNPQEFGELLLFQFNKDLSAYTSPNNNFPQQLLDIIQDFNRRNQTEVLLRAARMSRPIDPGLLLCEQEFGAAAITLPNTVSIENNNKLERLIKQANGFVDVRVWRESLARLENQICRIEITGAQPPTFGTGFLLGPDLVITNYHVMEDVIKGEISIDNVSVRFDYALMADGVTQDPGTVYKLDEVLDYSEYSPLDLLEDTGGQAPSLDHLDYALLLVDGNPGEEPVGGEENKNPEAPQRGWIQSPAKQHKFEADSALLILQHPNGAPMKLAMDLNSIIGINQNNTRVRYRTNTEPGSSGSPCFDADWNLIALHHAGDPNFDELHKPEYNEGIPFHTIHQRLKTKELL